MADRNVAADDTFAEFRKTMQETMTDVGDISQLGNNFGGTPVSYTHLTLPTKRIV